MTIPVGGYDPQQFQTQYTNGTEGVPNDGIPVPNEKPGDDVPPANPSAPKNDGGDSAPTLPPASKPVYELDLDGMWYMTASLGANVLSMCKETLNEQRQANQEARNAESQIVIKTLDEQAKTIREQAIVNLGMSIATGVMQIAMGVVSVVGGVKGFNMAMGSGPNAGQAAMALNTKFTGYTQAMGGLNSMLTGAKEYVSSTYDVELKMLDKKAEMARTMISALDSTIDKLKEVIRDANQNQSSLASQNAETLKKILA